MNEHDDADVGPETDPPTTQATPVGGDPSLVAERYRILRTLGRGGGGHVWLARDEKLSREVALKRVGGEADAEELLTRGFREARTSAALANEHVVRVYDVFEHDGSPWIVMEYVDGTSLADLLQDGQRLPVEQVAVIGAQMATALAAAHSAGILHRDVKPGNVLLHASPGSGGIGGTGDAASTDAKLTDFGIARAEEDAQLTRTGFVSGTAAYFSPELARGEDATAASDVWALGATLYAAVEGRRPFPDRPNAVAQLHTIVRELPQPTRHAGRLAPVLAGMLEPDPVTRWDAARAARELGEVARGGVSGGGTGVWGSGSGQVPGGAGAAAAAAATARRQDPAGSAAGDGYADPTATQAVPLGEPTRSFPRAARPVEREQHPRAGARRETGTGRDPRGDHRGTRPAARTSSTRRRPPRHRPRTSVLLGWLLAVPLALALGWLVWTIAADQGLPGTDGTAQTQAADAAPVTGQEAVALASAFYTDTAYLRLDEARAHLAPGVDLPDEVTTGLTRLNFEQMVPEPQDDGTVRVTSTVNYTYGDQTRTEQEELVVGRTESGGDPLIVRWSRGGR